LVKGDVVVAAHEMESLGHILLNIFSQLRSSGGETFQEKLNKES
jgi:hypothetical protein